MDNLQIPDAGPSRQHGSSRAVSVSVNASPPPSNTANTATSRRQRASHQVISSTQQQHDEPAFRDVYSHPAAVAYAAAHPRRTIPRFGPYLLLQTLGEGEFGKVKLGLHQQWGEEVAVKLIRRGNIDSSVRMAKVEREIEVLRTLKHPNIVRLYDVIETDKYIGIILEYASGGELFDHILAHRYLKEKDAAKLFAQLISGVWYIHQKKIVHRDLKLENLLLDRHRNVIITDFGFANRFEHRADDLMQTSCGSPCYAAPELVISEGLYVGSAVDIWSCGVILYAMLAGYLPFDDDPANPDGDNINLLYKYIVNTPLSFPEHVSPEARDLLGIMLVADPAHRADLRAVMAHPWLALYPAMFQRTVDELERSAMEQHQIKRAAYQRQMRQTAQGGQQQPQGGSSQQGGSGSGGAGRTADPSRVARAQSARVADAASASSPGASPPAVPAIASRSQSYRDPSQQPEFLYETSASASVDQSIYSSSVPAVPALPSSSSSASAAGAGRDRRAAVAASQIVMPTTAGHGPGAVDDDPFAPPPGVAAPPPPPSSYSAQEERKRNGAAGASSSASGSGQAQGQGSGEKKKAGGGGFRHTIQVEYGEGRGDEVPRPSSSRKDKEKERQQQPAVPAMPQQAQAQSTRERSASQSTSKDRSSRQAAAAPLPAIAVVTDKPQPALPVVVPSTPTASANASAKENRPVPPMLSVTPTSPAAQEPDVSFAGRMTGDSSSSVSSSRHKRGISVDKFGLGKIFGAGAGGNSNSSSANASNANGAAEGKSGQTSEQASVNGSMASRVPSEATTAEDRQKDPALLSPTAEDGEKGSQRKKTRRNTLTVMLEPVKSIKARSRSKQNTPVKDSGSAASSALAITPTPSVATPSEKTALRDAADPNATMPFKDEQAGAATPSPAAAAAAAGMGRATMPASTTKARDVMRWFRRRSSKTVDDAQELTVPSSAANAPEYSSALNTPASILRVDPSLSGSGAGVGATPPHPAVASARAFAGMGAGMAVPAPAGPPVVPKLADVQLRIHHGPLDQTTITTRPPPEVMARVCAVLDEMGIEFKAESEYKYRCVRAKRRRAGGGGGGGVGFGSLGGNGLAAFTMVGSASSNGLDKRGLPVPSTPSTPGGMLRGLLMRRQSSQVSGTAPSQPLLSPTEDDSSAATATGAGEASPGATPTTTTPPAEASANGVKEPVYGDQQQDASDEVRFSVELTRIDRLKDTYSLDIRRLKGNLRS